MENLRINRNPGKFEGELVISEYVYELSTNGCDDEITIGDMWYGLLRGSIEVSGTSRLDMQMTQEEVNFLATREGVIITEDSQGFISVTYYNDSAFLNDAWRLVEDVADEFYGDNAE